MSGLQVQLRAKLAEVSIGLPSDLQSSSIRAASLTAGPMRLWALGARRS